jgi:hypothetical protein
MENDIAAISAAPASDGLGKYCTNLDTTPVKNFELLSENVVTTICDRRHNKPPAFPPTLSMGEWARP